MDCITSGRTSKPPSRPECKKCHVLDLYECTYSSCTKVQSTLRTVVFHILIVMEERSKRAWAGYKRYKLVMRIIAAFVGITVGIAGCIAFSTVYHNYDAASWAGVSAIFATVFLYLHFAVRRDLERVISRDKFNVILWIGFGGMCSGIIGFITSIALGVRNHETGVNTNGNFIVCVWNFMTFKWGLLTFLAARKFRKIYYELDPQSRVLVEST